MDLFLDRGRRTMMRKIVCGLAVCLLAVGTASAATQGLWLFEDLVVTRPDDTSDAGIGEQTSDSSGNGLHITAGSKFGAVSLSSDVPPVQPAGSTSLHFQNRPVFETPATDLLSIGNTDQLTIEFWYKPMLVDTLRFIVVQAAGEQGHSAYNLAQAVPAEGASALDVFTSTAPDGTAVRWRDGEKFITDQTGTAEGEGWTHIAVTIDGNNGEMKVYRDGVVDPTNERTGFTPYDPLTSTLRIGATNPAGSFTNNFLMDDLRISDTVLLPGDGTGVGELAWNTTLIPEPATLGLLALGGLMLARRRRG
jgi:hypothetical protein